MVRVSLSKVLGALDHTGRYIWLGRFRGVQVGKAQACYLTPAIFSLAVKQVILPSPPDPHCLSRLPGSSKKHDWPQVMRSLWRMFILAFSSIAESFADIGSCWLLVVLPANLAVLHPQNQIQGWQAVVWEVPIKFLQISDLFKNKEHFSSSNIYRVKAI